MPKPPDHLADIRRRLASISTGPGVYRWLDAEGNVLYVGKAKNLRNRLRSYVQVRGPKRSAWTDILVRNIADFDVTVTNTELEALLLEANLVRELRPKYNILLKDDKNDVYLRIAVQDAYPSVEITRRMAEDGAKYFGPFLGGARKTNDMLDMLDDILKFRACKKSLEGKARGTPCLEYQIGKCCGLCIGAVSREEYLERIGAVERFFRGNFQPTKKKAEEDMQAAARERKFERAARIRDVLKFIANLESRQIVSDTSGADTDIIGAALLAGRAHVVLLKERDGKLIGEESFALQGHAESIAEVLGEFLPQYYMEAADLPATIIVGEAPEDQAALEEWFGHLRGKKVALHVPERGKKSKLLLLAEKNADWKARQQEAKWEAEIRKRGDALTGLQSLLKLPALPKRIEGYDISHQGGYETVASMVVFENGQPKRQHYRSFNIRTVKKGNVDDYQSLREALRRRLSYLTQSIAKEESAWKERGIVFAKAKKADADFLAEKSGGTSADCKEFVVAWHGQSIAAFICLHAHPGNVVEIRSFWSEERYKEDGRLEAFMIRRLCAKANVRKLYVLIDATEGEEERYARIGFRYVITPPESLSSRVSETRIVVVYDCKEHKIDESFSAAPDVILIDGGKGQLGAVKEVIDQSKLPIVVISIAKRLEEVFIPDEQLPILIPKEAPAQFLLQRIRDESHRFANDRRKRRAKSEAIRSALDEIPGVGGVLKQKLLARFGSVDGVRRASDEELFEVLNEEQVRAVREYFE